jgi:hypothetical protein
MIAQREERHRYLHAKGYRRCLRSQPSPLPERLGLCGGNMKHVVQVSSAFEHPIDDKLSMYVSVHLLFARSREINGMWLLVIVQITLQL